MREYVTAADRIAREQTGPVLDWGCGFGHISHLLREHGLTVTSVDYDPGSDLGGSSKPSDRFPDVQILFLEDAVKLPFADDSYDSVLSMGVLEHVLDPEGSVAEVRRVLRPGGTFYVYKLPNRFSYLEWISRRLGMPYHGEREEDVLYTRRGARELLERHGFEVVELRLANMLPLTLPGRLARLASPVIWRLNVLLARVPLLNLLATNVEAVARNGR